MLPQFVILVPWCDLHVKEVIRRRLRIIILYTLCYMSKYILPKIDPNHVENRDQLSLWPAI